MSDHDKQPNVFKYVPWCSGEACRQFDGKRCRMTGFQPDSICEPTVIEMAEELVRLRGIETQKGTP